MMRQLRGFALGCALFAACSLALTSTAEAQSIGRMIRLASATIVALIAGHVFLYKYEEAGKQAFRKVYYSWVWPGCNDTPVALPNGTIRALCPPLTADFEHIWGGQVFPPGPSSRNGCLGVTSYQIDIEINPSASSWTNWSMCGFDEIQRAAEIPHRLGPYTRLSDHQLTDEVCPLRAVDQGVGVPNCVCSGPNC